jgi:uncharacterized membrane protein
MNWYLTVKFLHIVATIMFVGGVFARQFVRSSAKKTSDVKFLASIMHGAGQIEKIMVIPGSNVTVILGIVLAIMLHLPIFGFLQGGSQNWLLVSNILLVIGLVLIPTVFIPRGKKFEPILEAALTEGRVTPELQAAMDDKVVQYAHIFQEVSIIVIVALMVLKPF